MELDFEVFNPKPTAIEGATYPCEAPDPQRRLIIVCGCSISWDKPDRRPTPWPVLLQQSLGPSYQVVLMSFGASGLGWNVEWFYRYGETLRPAAVILQPPEFTRQPFPELQQDRLSNYFVWTGAASLTSFQERSNPLTPMQFLAQCDELIRRDLQRMGHFLTRLQEGGTQPLVLLYEYCFRSLLEPLARKQYRQMRRLCRKQRVPCSPVLKASRFARDGKTKRDGVHPNDAGCGQLRDEALSLLRAAGELPLRAVGSTG